MADGNIKLEVSTQAAQTELKRLRVENAALKRDLEYARSGLTKGRTRMREDLERLREVAARMESPPDAGACLLDGGVMPLRAAYADPPYLGCGVKHYGTRHEKAAEYDDPEAHRRLIERLSDEFDCWALSLHEPSLRTLLTMCPTDVRVGSWVKPFAAFKANVTRAWTWEPVIFRFSAQRPRARTQPTWRDHIAEPIAMRRGFPGAKPEKVCFWIFDGLNLRAGDEFHDLFPGSGAVGEAWEMWRYRVNLPEPMQRLLWAKVGEIPGVAEA